jgi:hypothetical protein
MKTIELKPADARFLKLQLERKDGFSLGDLRKINKFLMALDIVCKPYDSAIEEALKKYPPQFDDQGRQFVDRRLNEIVEKINSEHEEPVSFNVEDADFECVHGIWTKIESWGADRSNRRAVLAIDDALAECNGKA